VFTPVHENTKILSAIESKVKTQLNTTCCKNSMTNENYTSVKLHIVITVNRRSSIRGSNHRQTVLLVQRVHTIHGSNYCTACTQSSLRLVDMVHENTKIVSTIESKVKTQFSTTCCKNSMTNEHYTSVKLHIVITVNRRSSIRGSNHRQTVLLVQRVHTIHGSNCCTACTQSSLHLVDMHKPACSRCTGPDH
jgi:hypothetical protein